MKTVGIIYNPDKPKAKAELAALSKWLKKKKCNALSFPSSVNSVPFLDFAITLGGDGTMLKAGRLLAPKGIPVLGINLGSLGFLADTNPGEALTFISQVLAGKYETEERMMLSVALKSKTKTIKHLALNDAVILSGTTGRTLNISSNIGTEFLANYVGDGLIVSTPTGSTGYSLAADGPIVQPQLSLLVITPICPHTLAERPMIVSTKHAISFQASSKDGKVKPILSIDGQLRYQVGSEDWIFVTKAEYQLRLIINPKRRYLEVLRTKLKWNERG